MASARSSQEMWCGRDRQPQNLGSSQPRHRSRSRRLSEPRRPVKGAAHKRDRCPGALHEGDPVRVFSCSADKWVDGEVVQFLECNFVRVEYEVGEYRCGKSIHIHSDHLAIPLIISRHDPGEVLPEGALASAPYTLREYLAEKHIHGNAFGSNPCQRPSTFDFSCDGYVHKKTGVVVHFRPIRLGASSAGPYQVLFHYTQKHFFELITTSQDPEGIHRSMLKASQDLSKDCDFGAGVYATEKGPEEFPHGIEGIILNNYPRKGPWGFAGEPGEQHRHLASHCIPIIVPRSWTKSYPVTLDSPTTFGRILERRMRQGHFFDSDRHNIYVIQGMEIQEQGMAIDEGLDADSAFAKQMALTGLDDADPNVRHRAVERLDQMLSNYRDCGGAAGIAGMELRLALKGNAAAFQALIRSCTDMDVSVRQDAVNIVGQVAQKEDTAALEALAQCLDDTDPKVRILTTKFLGKLFCPVAEGWDRRSWNTIRREVERELQALGFEFGQREVLRSISQEARHNNMPYVMRRYLVECTGSPYGAEQSDMSGQTHSFPAV